jgi:S1-C subfamily serine protease
MPEGLFDPHRLAIPGVPVDTLIGAMVRVLPSTLLRIELVETAQQAGQMARNEMLPEGTELWHRPFTRTDMGRCDEPGFALNMVSHEFCTLVRQGASFPQTVKLEGGGSGFAVSPAGHVLTNLHLVSSEVEHHRREEGAVNSEVRCAQLKAQVARRDPDGTWRWHDCDAVYLVSSPPFARGYRQDADGNWHLQEDTALLRVEPAPAGYLPLSMRSVAVGEPVWMAGFPLRTARHAASRERLGYRDADGTLRVSSGKVTGEEGDDYFVADLDGSMGNSGSPVFDGNGLVVGMFSRAFGERMRHVQEYGHISRVQVRASVAVKGLELDRVIGRAG